jgi:hypothetical protein
MTRNLPPQTTNILLGEEAKRAKMSKKGKMWVEDDNRFTHKLFCLFCFFLPFLLPLLRIRPQRHQWIDFRCSSCRQVTGQQSNPAEQQRNEHKSRRV